MNQIKIKLWCNFCDKFIPISEAEISPHDGSPDEILFSHHDNHLLMPTLKNYTSNDQVQKKVEEAYKKGQVDSSIQYEINKEKGKCWYFEGDELVIKKGKWIIDRYKKHLTTKEEE